MNNVISETKISCLLFTCPMVEEIKSCHLSNLRMVTSKQKVVFDEKIEEKGVQSIIAPKFLCLKHRAE